MTASPHHPPRWYTEMYKGFTFPTNINIDDPLDDKPEGQRVWAASQLKRNSSLGNGPGQLSGNQQ